VKWKIKVSLSTLQRDKLHNFLTFTTIPVGNNKVAVPRPDKEWNSEEIEALTTSYDRYPVGVANRWEKITNYVNNILQFKDGLLTQDDVLRNCYRQFAKK
jgi:hypothetical protein